MSALKTAQTASQFESRRFRTNHKVSFRLASEESHRNAYLLNLSMTGMFIRCEDPPQPGTSLSFELFPGKDEKTISGQAQVVWTRSRDDGHDRPQGMGVTISRMDPQCQQHLRAVVGRGLEQSGDLPETEQLRSIVDDALGESATSAGGKAAASPPSASSTGTYYNASEQRSRRHGFDVLALAALFLLLGVAGSLYYLRGGSGDGEAEVAAAGGPAGSAPASDPAAASSTPDPAGSSGEAAPGAGAAATGNTAVPGTATPEPAASGTATPESTSPEPAVPETAAPETAAPETAAPGTATPETAAPAAEPAAAAASEPEAPSPDPGLARDAVEAWAAAWSAQDVEGYLASYARDFDPPRNMSRRRWEADRRTKLSRPEFIRVTLSRMQVEGAGEGRARVVFDQEYRSNTYGDKVRKAMVLVWEEGAWKILEENVLAKIE